MRMSRPRGTEESYTVTVRDNRNLRSESNTYYETSITALFDLLDQNCEDYVAGDRDGEKE